MRFQILSIIVWPKNAALEPRVVRFVPGVVNVVTGASKTGKSAIIPIIDYCLGAEKCAIPVETIRDVSAWFGVLVQLAQGQLLLARREPGLQKSTSDMYVLEGESVQVPREIRAKNHSVDLVKQRLDELSGLSLLDFDFEKLESGFKGRSSFRDLMAFVFQPQNIIANPDVLFFKADTYEHREKLKTIFPYVLKAVTPQSMAAQHELARIRRELARRERELTNLRTVSQRWLADLQGWVSRGKELGLIAEPVPADADRSRLVTLLRHAVGRQPEVVTTVGQVEAAVRELNDLVEEDAAVAGRLSLFRRRLAEMERLKQAGASYGAALHVQRDRLAISKWLGHLSSTGGECPLCAAPFSPDEPVLAELQEALESVEREAEAILTVPASFERELQRVKEEISLATEQLRAISIRSAALQDASGPAREQRLRSDAAARYLGGLEQALATHDALDSDSELAQEVAELRAQFAVLQQQLSLAGIRDRLQRALERITNIAGRLLPDLDAERPQDPMVLSIVDLTVQVRGLERVDYLWEIGSGANWLSYHVAASLALQWFFQERPGSPVPSFLVYDQPSQVYFPRKVAGTAEDTPDSLDPNLQDEDAEAVRRVFVVIARVVSADKNGGMQAIILDHAGRDVWGNVDGVYLVEEWRRGQKLIPESWLTITPPDTR